MKQVATLVAGLLLVCSAAAQPMTQEDAFAAGSSAGKSNTATMKATISETKGTEIIGDYATTPPAQSSYWNGGGSLTNVLTGGASQVTTCDSGAGVTGARDKNHCEAVNAIAKQPSIKPSGLIDKTDPMIVKGDAIVANPDAVAGAMASLYTACETKTETTLPEKTIETCDEYSTTGEEKCVSGQEVVVDPDHLYRCRDSVQVVEHTQCTVGRTVVVDTDVNYECTKTNSLLNTYNCNKTLSVEVTWHANCIAGTWSRLVSLSKNHYDKMYVDMLCEPERVDGHITVRAYAHGYVGACVGWVQATIPINQPSLAQFASLGPHWEHACRTGFPAYHGAGSCDGNNNCTKYFYFGGGGYAWLYSGGANANFAKPYRYYTTTESWANGCTTYEARAQ